jgi:hypothetical protein
MARRQRIGAGFYALLFGVMVLTFVVHEAGHWAAGRALGYEAYFSLNSAGVRDPSIPVEHMIAVRAGGVVVTLLQALLGLTLLLTRGSLAAYAVLFSAAFMRFMAAVMTLMQPNDEAAITLAMGWGRWSGHALVVALLVGMTIWGARHLRIGWKANLLAWAVASVAVTAVVGLDMALQGGL